MNPIAKKLLIKPGTNWLFVNAPEDYLAYIDPLPDNVHVSFESSDKVDGLQLFVKNKAELTAELKTIQPALKPDTILWITYPKKNTKIPTDLAMMDSWDEVKQYGLDTVASAAINDTWTALRFRPKNLVKTSPAKLSEIPKSDFSEYIDVTNKKVTLPPDVLEALKEAPQALDTFTRLAWSHQKEYAVWILGAKQEKTRVSRVEKMVEMLVNGKKNPSEK
ncbi:YdeI/OmpD-associated family protein [Mucilaginibacter jinjuensis]|uniref:YdeI/OmpD-associated family protein n=1 Tax=Mucilaginibacter jinjuensis TaxID=1176721 RepID=A0ABY7TDX7_9SPHI|nr:YdeI/OmpD-associated family protein [Mucilaginibacter jinjuensis]WCT14656.1 YdeI/OmpD-associated family protein [Mucilaginibacter jinjuensis]